MHPLFFRIGNFYIGTYGVMLALGLAAGLGAALYRARREAIPSETVLDVVFYAILGGIVGGRVAYIVVYFDDFLKDPWGVLLSRTGFVFLGSLVGAIAMVVWAAWRRRLAFWRLADVLITGVPLGHAFGRIGCFFAGCCFGGVLPPDSPWAWLGVQFPPAVYVGKDALGGQAFWQHSEQGLLPPDATCSLAVWPTQLMESAANLLIFLALMWAWRRRRFGGQVFLVYLALYSVVRFLIEFLRGDADRGFVGPLSTSQALGLAALVVVIALWPILAKRGLGGPAVATVAAAKAEPQTAANGRSPKRARPRRKR